jgi:hypothetical protein
MTVVNAASVNFVARHAALMFGQQQKTKLFAFGSAGAASSRAHQS